jgi:AraC-like DNA-binding protein/quercetin dioxygenase-like cupin family protein
MKLKSDIHTDARVLVAPIQVPSARLPVAAVVLNLPARSRMPAHAHRHARLIHAVEGTLDVICDGRNWTLPPHRALWVPAGVEHEMTTRAPARMRSLDFVSGLTRGMPRAPFAINVGYMLKALIHRAVETGLQPRGDPHQVSLLRAIPREIELSQRSGIAIPFPADRRLVKICRRLLKGEGLRRPLADWAGEAGGSGRTLERLFKAETGLTFVQWRQHAMMQMAIGELVSGAPIAAICERLEIQSTSAFHKLFRRTFGMTPMQYLRDLRQL